MKKSSIVGLLLLSSSLILASCNRGSGTKESSSSSTPATTSEHTPVTTSEAPVTTSEAPITTSEEKPVTTSEAPVTTSEQKPVTTSEIPVTTSEEKPVTTSEVPVTTSEEKPVTTSEAPVATSEEPLPIESSEELPPLESSEELPVVTSEAAEFEYAIVIDGVEHGAIANPEAENEFMVLGVEVAVGAKVEFKNYSTGSTWTPILDEASKGFEQRPEGIFCIEANKYDFYFKMIFGGDQLYVGYADGDEPIESSEDLPIESSEEELGPKYEVSSKYALIVDGVAHELEYNEEPLDPSFDEYYVLGVEVEEGQHVWFYDSETYAEWIFKNLSGSEAFEIVGSDIVCNVSGTYDFYAKFKLDADELYIGDHSVEPVESSEEAPVESSEEELGPKYDIESRYALIVDGVAHELIENEEPLDPSFDEYYVLGVEVEEGQHVWFYDSETYAEWIFTKLSGSEAFEVVDSDIVCNVSGTYDFYAKFKYDADELYIGDHSVEPVESSEETPVESSEEEASNKYVLYDIDAGTIVADLVLDGTQDYQGRDQASATNVTLTAGLKFCIYDTENYAGFISDVEGWSFGGKSASDTAYEEYLSVEEDHYEVLKDCTVDIYAKFAWENNSIYFGLK